MPNGVKNLIISESHSTQVYPGSSSLIDLCTDIAACASSYEHLYSYTGIVILYQLQKGIATPSK